MSNMQSKILAILAFLIASGLAFLMPSLQMLTTYFIGIAAGALLCFTLSKH